MDAAATQESPGKSSFDQKVEIRAERHEHLRGRNNVTSCRSPIRESETLRIKTELKEKRHQNFQRRRSVSPEPPGVSRCRNCSSRLKFSPRSIRWYNQNSRASFWETSNECLLMMSTQSNASNGQRSNRWVKLPLLTLKTLISLTDTGRALAVQSLTIPAPASSLPTPAGFMVVRKHNCDKSQEIYLHTENR